MNETLYFNFISKNLSNLEYENTIIIEQYKSEYFKILYPIICNNKHLIALSMKTLTTPEGFNAASILARSSFEYATKIQWAILSEENWLRFIDGITYERKKFLVHAQALGIRGIKKRDIEELGEKRRMPDMSSMLKTLGIAEEDSSAYFSYRALSLAVHGNAFFAEYKENDIFLNYNNEDKLSVLLPLLISLTATISVMDLLTNRNAEYSINGVPMIKWLTKENLKPKTILD